MSSSTATAAAAEAFVASLRTIPLPVLVLLFVTAVAFLVTVLRSLRRRQRPVYLLNYSCHLPDVDRQVNLEVCKYFGLKCRRYSDDIADFMRLIYSKSGLGQVREDAGVRRAGGRGGPVRRGGAAPRQVRRHARRHRRLRRRLLHVVPDAVAFGSLMKLSWDEMDELDAGLASTGRPFLLVVRDNNRSSSLEIASCRRPAAAGATWWPGAIKGTCSRTALSGASWRTFLAWCAGPAPLSFPWRHVQGCHGGCGRPSEDARASSPAALLPRETGAQFLPSSPVPAATRTSRRRMPGGGPRGRDGRSLRRRRSSRRRPRASADAGTWLARPWWAWLATRRWQLAAEGKLAALALPRRRAHSVPSSYGAVEGKVAWAQRHDGPIAQEERRAGSSVSEGKRSRTVGCYSTRCRSFLG